MLRGLDVREELLGYSDDEILSDSWDVSKVFWKIITCSLNYSCSSVPAPDSRSDKFVYLFLIPKLGNVCFKGSTLSVCDHWLI